MKENHPCRSNLIYLLQWKDYLCGELPTYCSRFREITTSFWVSDNHAVNKVRRVSEHALKHASPTNHGHVGSGPGVWTAVQNWAVAFLYHHWWAPSVLPLTTHQYPARRKLTPPGTAHLYAERTCAICKVQGNVSSPLPQFLIHDWRDAICLASVEEIGPCSFLQLDLAGRVSFNNAGTGERCEFSSHIAAISSAISQNGSVRMHTHSPKCLPPSSEQWARDERERVHLRHSYGSHVWPQVSIEQQ